MKQTRCNWFAGRSRPLLGWTIASVVVIAVAGSVSTRTVVAEAPSPPKSISDQGANAGFVDPLQAFSNGRGAFLSRHYELAIPALAHAAKRGVSLSNYYLARIYADNYSPHTDHGRAFRLFRELVRQQGDVDPEDYNNAPYVAEAWTALGRYVRKGIDAIGLKPDVTKAIEYFTYAAQEFGHQDAQFELAKLQLEGEGVEQSVPRALHWLAALSTHGHPGAQAFLADLFWRGKFVKQDLKRALALSSVALRNSGPANKVWIAHLHQQIYCGVNKNIRRNATGLVATWTSRKLFEQRRPRVRTKQEEFLPIDMGPVRRCGDGELVQVLPKPDNPSVAKKAPAASAGETIAQRKSRAGAESAAIGSSERVIQADRLFLFGGAGLNGILRSVEDVAVKPPLAVEK